MMERQNFQKRQSYEFVDTIHKAHQSFQDGSEEPWEKTIYKHSKTHHVIGKYEYHNEDADYGTRLSICIRWFFQKDQRFNCLVEEGLNQAIDTTKITGDSHYLRRGCYMDANQLAILYSNLATLMDYSYYETDSKKHVIELVDYALSSSKMHEFLKEKLED